MGNTILSNCQNPKIDNGNLEPPIIVGDISDPDEP